MFFKVYIPPDEIGSSPEKPELNRDGEPMYLIDAEEGIIINDPTLLISKEISSQPPSQEDLDRTMRMTSVGWAPLMSFNYWRNSSPAQ